MEYLIFIISALISLIINLFERIRPEINKNILLIRLDHIGDMACTLEIIQNLRREYYSSNITLITGQWNEELFVNSPLVNDIIVYNSPRFTRNKNQTTRFLPKISMLKQLRKKKYDLLIDFRGDLFITVASFFILPRKRRDRGTIRLKNKYQRIKKNFGMRKYRLLMHEIETNKEIINGLVNDYKESKDYFGFSEAEKKWLNEYLKQNNLLINSYAIIHPGASWEYRRWDIKNFKEVGRYIYNQYGLKSFIIGSKDEYNLGIKILKNSRAEFINIIGVTTLRQTIQLILNSSIVICNDSGPMHISAVSGKSTIALLGPQEIERFGPKGSKVIYFHKKLECYPCKQIICKHPDLPCVNLNTYQEVIKAIGSLLPPPNNVI